MNKKLAYKLLTIEIFICFIPITFLWMLGCFMGIVLLISDPEIFNYLFLLPSVFFPLLGAIGLIGLLQMINHIQGWLYPSPQMDLLLCQVVFQSL